MGKYLTRQQLKKLAEFNPIMPLLTYIDGKARLVTAMVAYRQDMKQVENPAIYLH